MLSSSLQENKDKLTQEIYHYISDLEHKLKQIITTTQANLEELQDKQKNAEYKQARIKGNLMILDEEITNAKNEWEMDLERSGQLTYYLKKAFLDQFSFYNGKLMDGNVQQEEKWLYHQYLIILQKQAEGII